MVVRFLLTDQIMKKASKKLKIWGLHFQNLTEVLLYFLKEQEVEVVNQKNLDTVA